MQRDKELAQPTEETCACVPESRGVKHGVRSAEDDAVMARFAIPATFLLPVVGAILEYERRNTGDAVAEHDPKADLTEEVTWI